jgi:ribosome-associated toxin RatA of RatAB toxin-antitoxin module
MEPGMIFRLLPLAAGAVCICVLCGCDNTYVFDKRIPVAAMPDKVFSVASDFASYPALFPDLYKQVNITSKVREGKGVVFESVCEFKGFTTRNTWEVVEYEKNKLIRMESPSAGTIIVLINQIDYNTTEETMIVVTRLPDNYKKEIFAIYEKEMAAVKEKCER